MTPPINPHLQSLYANYAEMPYISPDRNLEEWLSRYEQGLVSPVPRANMVRTPEGLLPGHIILLWRISLGTFTSASWFPKYFEYTYGVDGSQALATLIEIGYVIKASAKASLDHVAAPVLKSLLKNKGVTGLSKMKKADLIAEVLAHYQSAELDDVIALRHYQLTPKGQIALSNNQAIVAKHPKKPGYSKNSE